MSLQVFNRVFKKASIAVLLMSSAFVGCDKSGPATYPVSGKVTFDGKPLADGDIILVSQDAKTPVAGKIQAGEFQINALAGKSRVEIRASRETGEKTTMGPIRRDFIPACYNSQSTLTIEVKDSGIHDCVFDLKSQHRN
jgi:hypothetical protein